MSEAIPYDTPKPVISEELVLKLAEILALDDRDQIEQFGVRLQRYASTYYNACKRANLEANVGNARKDAKEELVRIRRLRKEVAKLRFNEPVLSAYRTIRRSSHKRNRPSIEGLAVELEAYEAVLNLVVEAPPAVRGPKGRPRLRNAIGSIMALFDAVGVERPRVVKGDKGELDDFLAGTGGQALRMIFESIAPEIEEGTLARQVERLLEEYRDDPMIEGNFHVISRIEDQRRIEIVHA